MMQRVALLPWWARPFSDGLDIRQTWERGAAEWTRATRVRERPVLAAPADAAPQ